MLNICINKLIEIMDCTLPVLAGYSKLGGPVNMLKGRAVIQRNRHAGGMGQQGPYEIQQQ